MNFKPVLITLSFSIVLVLAVYLYGKNTFNLVESLPFVLNSKGAKGVKPVHDIGVTTSNTESLPDSVSEPVTVSKEVNSDTELVDDTQPVHPVLPSNDVMVKSSSDSEFDPLFGQFSNAIQDFLVAVKNPPKRDDFDTLVEYLNASTEFRVSLIPLLERIKETSRNASKVDIDMPVDLKSLSPAERAKVLKDARQQLIDDGLSDELPLFDQFIKEFLQQ